MGGDVLTNGHEYDYDSATGVLNVSGVTGTVQITVTGIAVYSLSVAVADQSPYGSVDIVTGSATGNISGSTVKVIATPAQFYVFEKWVATDDIDAVAESVNAEYEFVIDANTTLYAVFQGDGTFHGPIQINSVAQMTAFASRVNDGTEPIGRYYILTADLDLGDQWIPIGTNVTNDAAGGFRGYFDGGGHTITINGIGTLEAADIYYVGIFGYLGEGGLIQNLRAEGSLNITQNLGEYHIGGIVGRMNNHATIQNCVGAVDIVANLDVPHAFAGGIVGFTSTASDLVSNCYSTADVSVINSRTAFAGGIVGFHNFGTVSQCYATGEIDAQSTIETAVSSAGGVVGRSNNGYITNCFALNTGITCSAAIPDNSQIGRIVGSQVGEMSFLTNNRAISISGIDTEGGLSANKDGALISASFAEEMSTYQTLASWPFGYDNPAPWAWNSAIINRPILYWEDI
jgi:predicted small secreted protein